MISSRFSCWRRTAEIWKAVLYTQLKQADLHLQQPYDTGQPGIPVLSVFLLWCICCIFDNTKLFIRTVNFCFHPLTIWLLQSSLKVWRQTKFLIAGAKNQILPVKFRFVVTAGSFPSLLPGWSQDFICLYGRSPFYRSINRIWSIGKLQAFSRRNLYECSTNIGSYILSVQHKYFKKISPTGSKRSSITLPSSSCHIHSMESPGYSFG